VSATWGPPHAYSLPKLMHDKGQQVPLESEMRRRMAEHAEFLENGATATPQHCSRAEGCLGPHAVTAKQKKLIELYGALTMAPQPDVASMGFVEAQDWTKARYAEYMAQH